MSALLASVVVLCHNDRRYLRGCLDSLARHTKSPHELILVDNASPDGAREDLLAARREYPFPVKLVLNDRNRFFAGGNNQGLRLARGRHCVLLNADTVVTPGWLEGLAAHADADRGLGAVGPNTNQAAGTQVEWPAPYGSVEELPAYARRRGAALAGLRVEVPWLVGFCVLLPRRVLRRVGPLDRLFGPGGFEDYDLCLRVRLAGLRLAVARDVYIHHYGGRGYVDMRYEALRDRNRRLFWDKWSRWCRERLDGRLGPVPGGRREPSLRA
ncbi:MAG: glycosyltransferase family 2 protein [Elusimicrobiota bacterium]|nr:glycosyltransferase family 2 protein [Elusimicrobiota bacterium]